MYENVGGKIKGLAIYSMIAGFTVSVILGGLFFGSDDSIFIGIIIIAAGFLVSWVSSLAVYGFGQLIDNSDKIVESMEKCITYNSQNPSENSIVKEKSFYNLVQTNLSMKKSAKLCDIKNLYDQGLISKDECRKRISNELNDEPLDLVNQILNKL